jgi:hypothetical protein
MKNKSKTFCKAKITISGMKRQCKVWEEIFARYLSDQELISRMYKELQKLNTKRTNNPVNR